MAVESVGLSESSLSTAAREGERKRAEGNKRIFVTDLRRARKGLKVLLCPFGGDDSTSVVYLSEAHEVVLSHDPFEVYVLEKSGGEQVVSLNSRGLFDFEHLKVKSEVNDDDEEYGGENWEESFRSHTDKRPYGPQPKAKCPKFASFFLVYM